MTHRLNKIKITTLIIMTALISACSSSEEIAVAEGWEILFDGSNMDDWKGYNTDEIAKEWVIDGDALYFDPIVMGTGDGGDLVSKGQYGEFELRLEWKVAPGSNSGIFYHVVEDEKFENVYYSTVEMQVVDNMGHADGRIVKHQAGDLYDMISSNVKVAKPVGEWNDVRIIVKGNIVEHWMNGQMLVKTSMWDDNWATLIKNSKFATWPDFAQSKVGHIALQDHGDPVWFRNIKIKRFD